jgi:D-3-phosphoglycerate dehydrogenase
MGKYKVLYTDTDAGEYSVEAAVLKKVDADVILASATDEETLIREGKDCIGVMVLYADITKNVLDAWGQDGHVKVVCRQGIGYNNIDVAAASANGIMVANVPDYCLDEVADHTMALALCLMRELKSFNQRVEAGEWSEIPARPIRRTNLMTFGIYGLGNIAKRVAVRALAFGFQVTAFDPFVSDAQLERLGIGRANSLEELAAKSDILSLHAPVTPDTENTVNLEIFKIMKDSAFLINTSRGQLVKQADLEYAIENKLIAGAGLDVLADEPPAQDSPLFGRDNVIITSHVAFYSEESNHEILTKIAENVASTITDGKPRYWVNKPL